MSSGVAVVTGASRGAGQGIARALGAAGYTVYVTGRSQTADASRLGGTIHDTAEEVTAAGGRGIAFACDHADDAAVRGLFAAVERDEGRLDILVNNAVALHDELIRPGPFWTKPADMAEILTVGLRSSYIAAHAAAPLLVAKPGGLMVFTSAPGAVAYAHGPAYGAQKAGTDKMAADVAVELRPFGCASVSIWMGFLKTARTAAAVAERPGQFDALMAMAETPDFTGRLIAAIHRDPDMMALSGRTVIGAEQAQAYGVVDLDGSSPASLRPIVGGPVTYDEIVLD
ncbi:SDR family NAD(P)-dependent oxidoreductase [Sphingomonas jatrophae]|uniref:NAD(P)-dependent dehydrogenase, short-chain alcohol dehydrogenase family n=1 Tax=Sphingomonas jatrophae TaxID=1166337 RepID=A0A1I6KET8_9SPHN|nr:SDR family NAD(P)-dependent oxidoreductase [Sphingomonas jatrophae]SFR89664.1 NAD(P)-dependent dehydrogenase, short-chain alcohol dehydrogenase family [Sphingomonas jatrophae]